jgi:polysaccharide deacetylase 2 family uncharacterized protein YibQ
LRQHRASIVRASFGGALLAAFWLFWPGPDRVTVDQRHLWDRRLEEQFRNHGGGWASGAQAGITVSAKGQLVAAASHAPLEQRVADTIPAIGPPAPLAGEGTTALPGSDAPEPGAAGPIEMAALPPGEPEPTAPVAAPNGVVPAPPPVAPRSSAVAGATIIAHAATAAISEPAVADEVISAARLALGPISLVTPDMAVRRAPTWLRNAVAPVIDHRPAIAIVLDDLGLNRAGTAALNRLPAPLTLAFLPYAQGLEEQTRAARAAGHELMVHVPMEPTGNAWPGPNALLASLEPADLVARLRSQLSSFRGFVGINNHMGSLLTSDDGRMSLVMAELRQQGLLFLDSRTTGHSVAGRAARRLQVPYAERDVFLDNELDVEAVLRQLARVASIARSKGYAVAIGHPHAVTIEALRRWLPTLDAQGLALAPISAIVARRSCSEGAPVIDDACARYTAIASLPQ